MLLQPDNVAAIANRAQPDQNCTVSHPLPGPLLMLVALLVIQACAVWSSCAFQSLACRHAKPVAMASDAATRLYIGGLPADITSTQLAGRFASFGSLSAVDLVPRKYGSADACRGFAYVDFIPKDDQALHRCVSLVRLEIVCLG